MRLQVNGEHYVLDEGATVTDLARAWACDTNGVAAAVNETVVPRSLWAVHELREGDRVELLWAAQGG